MTPSPHEVTQLLVAWSNGDEGARDRLMRFKALLQHLNLGTGN